MKLTRMLSRYLNAAFLIVCTTLIPSLTAYASDIVVGSWNIQRLGHGSNKSFPALAAIASKVDLLAVQEVMTEDGITQLEQALEKHTGEPWSHLVSHALGENSYKEMYAFIWRESAVEYSEGAVVYLDRDNYFVREPFSAKFKSKQDNSELAIGTVHIVYGKRITDRTPEINALADYWLWMAEVYPNTPIVLAGDFNLPQSHAAWDPLKKYARPLVTQGASTLSNTPGKYANLYDNIWVERDTHLAINDAGIIDFPIMIGWDHKKSRKHVSDHAPLYMALGNSALDNATASISAFVPPETQSASPSTDGEQQMIRGNRNSNPKLFHRPDCPSYNRIAKKNRVPFASVAAAKAAGYRLAGNCP
ncbi:endonuclease/exonuclease/phosphatase family protein [Oceanisphaera pacifica]|uniref:Endonuclease/exonuclease/phosphatase family protein n=1 Tax=Oceanisphaera pacifica TaxID=2818389 RepID=A0ABS3NK92_9GAMM|nr:endonuclease/exonuclease/phosphatase family protein [Oceanisphaera pacifica]MBO1520651.1 endonuclease/exonuclease/phosphatase family protein [Oceanisphaera pacifica]